MRVKSWFIGFRQVFVFLPEPIRPLVLPQHNIFANFNNIFINSILSTFSKYNITIENSELFFTDQTPLKTAEEKVPGITKEILATFSKNLELNRQKEYYELDQIINNSKIKNKYKWFGSISGFILTMIALNLVWIAVYIQNNILYAISFCCLAVVFVCVILGNIFYQKERNEEIRHSEE